jgi:DUF4097 and DUF4098 domain-containing protein YvlB
MRNRIFPLLLSAFAAAVLLFASTAHASELTCQSNNSNWDDEATANAEQRLSIPANSVSTLHVRAAKNGGIRVSGWDSDHYEVLACKTAAGETDAEAQQRLSQIKMVLNGDQLTVEGPTEEHWTAFLLIHAPRNVNLDMHAKNGPIEARDLSGALTVDTENGPLSLRNCSGQVRATAKNGPIELVGTAGSATLTATNGPVSVKVRGNAWTGGQVEARTENGPIVLAVPEGFQSAFLAEASEHAPMSCAATVCEQARKTWDDRTRRIEYGNGSPVLKISTENGPIAVQTAKAEY